MSEALKELKDLLKKFSFKKSSYGKEIISPHRDWRIILSTTFVIIVLGAICGLYLYRQVDQGKLFFLSENKQVKEVKLDTKVLEITIDDLKARESLFNKVKDEKVVPPEPSV